MMNSTASPSAETLHAALSTEETPLIGLASPIKDRLEGWRTALAECARKPGPKRVHALRSLTLRLRAQLEDSLVAEERAFRRWRRQGRKLRRALQPVRDADVHLARLESLRKAEEGALRPGPDCLREIEEFETRLKRQRQIAAKELTAVLNERREKLILLSHEIEAAIGADVPAKVGPTRQAPLQIFIELASEPVSLDSSNLHAYRKRMKRALYLAELSSNTDPDSAQLAAEFRKIHDATGEWHDWQTLSEEAGRIFTGSGSAEGKPDSLIAVLEARADKALKIALDRCHEAAEHLTEMAGATELLEQLPPRKPVVSDPSGRGRNISLESVS